MPQSQHFLQPNFSNHAKLSAMLVTFNIGVTCLAFMVVSKNNTPLTRDSRRDLMRRLQPRSQSKVNVFVTTFERLTQPPKTSDRDSYRVDFESRTDAAAESELRTSVDAMRRSKNLFRIASRPE